ncbi:Uncharacterised protein [Enterobacter cloacae]|nr:Uncharacterised protein [Enterobacter cloacae]
MPHPRTLAATQQITFERELVQRRIDGVSGHRDLLRQRSRAGQMAAGPKPSAQYGLPQSKIERTLERLFPTFFQRSMEQGVKLITRYIHHSSSWYQKNIAWWFFLRNQQFINLEIFSI